MAYLAAYYVHRRKVVGRCENTTGVAAFTDLVSHVMTPEPYALADRVFWIVDNGCSHRGQAEIDRLQRKVLSPNDCCASPRMLMSASSGLVMTDR